MAGTKRISALPELTSGNVESSDILPIVDVTAGETKHATVGSVLALAGDFKADGSVDMAGDFVPDADGTRDIGSSSKRFAEAWFDDIKTGLVNGKLLSTPDAILEHQETSGTAGGSATSGSWQTRTLNTEVSDPGGIVTLSSNAFTVTVNCWCEARAIFNTCDEVAMRIYNVTDSAVVATGLNSFFANAGAGVAGEISVNGALVANKQYRIEYYCSITKTTNGLGLALSAGTERYARVELRAL